MFNDDAYFTLISPSFFYNNKRIVLVSYNKDINKSVELFWQNLSLLINNINVEFYNLPMIVKDNITDELFFISIKQSIVDFQLFKEVKKRPILEGKKTGILGLGRKKKTYIKKDKEVKSDKKTKYFNLLSEADHKLESFNFKEELYPKLETVFIFPMDDENQDLYSIPSLKSSVDIILLNLTLDD